jgi:hypothetical protein
MYCEKSISMSTKHRVRRDTMSRIMNIVLAHSFKSCHNSMPVAGKTNSIKDRWAACNKAISMRKSATHNKVPKRGMTARMIKTIDRAVTNKNIIEEETQ